MPSTTPSPVQAHNARPDAVRGCSGSNDVQISRGIPRDCWITIGVRR